MNRHWSDDELLGRLYGIGPQEPHLEECALCGARWRELADRRRLLLDPPAVPEGFLQDQRASILRRLESVSLSRWSRRLVPAFAVLLVVLAVALSGPSPDTGEKLAGLDSQFYSEVYSVVSSAEPRVAAPIRALFQE